ncbi:hypothetical protein V6N11_016130 [Hibiscus sabdariffa]|uniref:ABC transporter domain-containing protein n=1 Tax=Hibiscus sabdariffa TaxID=183260 RepID=A0ABR2TUQ4_9ROSI
MASRTLPVVTMVRCPSFTRFDLSSYLVHQQSHRLSLFLRPISVTKNTHFVQQWASSLCYTIAFQLLVFHQHAVDAHTSSELFKIRYAENLPVVLHGVTCTFPGGKKIGIVGRTGSGRVAELQAPNPSSGLASGAEGPSKSEPAATASFLQHSANTMTKGKNKCAYQAI